MDAEKTMDTECDKREISKENWIDEERTVNNQKNMAEKYWTTIKESIF